MVVGGGVEVDRVRVVVSGAGGRRPPEPWVVAAGRGRGGCWVRVMGRRLSEPWSVAVGGGIEVD